MHTYTLATPAAEELAEHCDKGHIPYRDWCPDCNEALGKERAHISTDSLHKRLVLLISCDYLFITQKSIFSRDELSEDEHEKALTVLLHRHKEHICSRNSQEQVSIKVLALKATS